MPEENPVTQTVSAGEHHAPSSEVWQEARERVEKLKQDSDQYIRQNPTKAVMTALAIGFVLGLMRRR
jgi:ElaB/YqjD/DUF883 family membrane-anchored ribosome-binding protein